MIIAATGHRPFKLGGYSKAASTRIDALACQYLEEAEPDMVISGMAQGWDTSIAFAALACEIPLTCAVPFRGQHVRWPDAEQRKFFYLLDHATRVIYVTAGGYHPAKMQYRNEWMVDNCDEVVALWDGSNGGTENCVRYALKQKKPVRNLWPVFIGEDDLTECLL